MNKSLEDILICPLCSNDLDITNTDELEFGIDNIGHTRLDVWCPNCNWRNRLTFQFTYNITEAYYSRKREEYENMGG